MGTTFSNLTSWQVRVDLPAFEWFQEEEGLENDISSLAGIRPQQADREGGVQNHLLNANRHEREKQRQRDITSRVTPSKPPPLPKTPASRRKRKESPNKMEVEMSETANHHPPHPESLRKRQHVGTSNKASYKVCSPFSSASSIKSPIRKSPVRTEDHVSQHAQQAANRVAPKHMVKVVKESSFGMTVKQAINKLKGQLAYTHQGEDTAYSCCVLILPPCFLALQPNLCR